MINSKEVKRIFERHGCDRYAKKLKATQLIILLILAQLRQHSGNRVIATDLGMSRKLQRTFKLEPLSSSQIFRRLQNFPPEAIEEVFQLVVKKVYTSLKFKKSTALEGLNLIDSSTITKALKGMEWAKFRDSKAGIKLHLSLMYHDELTYPKNAVISKAKEHDVAYLKDLVLVSKDVINVFDRGYVDYKVFDEFCETGVFFVTRLKGNAATWVKERYEVDSDSNVVYHDLVTIGSGKKKTKNFFRYIELIDEDGKTVRFVTNVMNKTIDEITEIYRLRWQIELFFKWIKQNLKVKHFYATSENSIITQIYIALIAFCLMQLLALELGTQMTLSKLVNAVFSDPFMPYTEFVEGLKRINPH